MKYPRLYTSLEEFERMELGSSTDWSVGRFLDDVFDDIDVEGTPGTEDEEEEE